MIKVLKREDRDRHLRHHIYKKQGLGQCAICERRFSGIEEMRVDHDHDTGTMRGILCNKCNVGIGFFRDNPLLLESAYDYLRRFAAKDNHQIRERTILDPVATAKLCGFKTKHLWKLVHEGKFPKPIKSLQTINGFRKIDVLEWMGSGVVRSRRGKELIRVRKAEVAPPPVIEREPKVFALF